MEGQEKINGDHFSQGELYRGINATEIICKLKAKRHFFSNLTPNDTLLMFQRDKLRTMSFAAVVSDAKRYNQKRFCSSLPKALAC